MKFEITSHRRGRHRAVILLTAFLFPFCAAHAQDAEQELEEIVVTGTAIKRTNLDSALPVQTITADEFKREGITNAGDLIATIPAMQGYITASDSVGGGGGGIRTANLRAIGSQYTLSLLDGRRMAPADSGSSIDLNNIPLAAVERVQILTDGASALYGSDAIAGVINFILKDEVDATTVSVRSDRPQEKGGEKWNFDLVTGLGDFSEDGYSIVASLSVEEQDQLKSAERDFARSGFVFFEQGGETLYFQNSSPNAIPGNANIWTEGFGSLIRSFNPYALQNGSCAENNTATGEACGFDYTSTLEVLPESERDSLTLNGRLRLSDNLTGFATVLASRHEMTTRIAPYPTGDIPLPLDSALVQDNILPFLSPEEFAQVGEVTVQWRAVPAGNRTTEWNTGSANLTLGVEGSARDIEYTASMTYAVTEIEQNFPSGWLLREEFVDAASSGAFNLLAAPEDFSEADFEALAPTIYSGNWDDTTNTMRGFNVLASKPMFELGGREVMLAAGLDYYSTNYDRDISEANANEALLFLSPDTPYDLERDQAGAYAELLLPLADTLETTVSLRYDDISSVSDKLAGRDIDDGDSDLTYKVSALWRPHDAIGLRASYGTGFKAPSMREIGEPRSEFGVTSADFVCPFQAPDPLAQFCKPQEEQYDVFREGSADLQFEHSTQYTFGAVLTPTDDFSVTVDYWNIELEDLVERLTEQQIFNNPEQYRHLFTTKVNLATGQEFLAIIQSAVNAGTREQSGIDYGASKTFDFGWGQLDLGLQGTYVIEAESSLTGSSLGRFGNDDDVVFRNVMNLVATLYHGDFTHTLFANYRSGYHDQPQEVEITGTGAPLGQGPTRVVQLEVPSYQLYNYQLRYRMLDESLELAFGVSNLADEEPPLSLRVSGAGHQIGWDPRYTDPYGRTFYLQAEYAFGG